jgi:ribosome-associated protein
MRRFRDSVYDAEHNETRPAAPVACQMKARLQITPRVALDPEELEETFVRSPGPGGQNVNKVATAVELRFDVARSPSLPEDVRARLARLAGRRLTAEGVLLIEAHRHRSQSMNREDARERLFALIRQASVAPKPRRPTKPSAAAQRRRVEEKKRRGAIKKARRAAEEG